jgi:hypothetical protein
MTQKNRLPADEDKSVLDSQARGKKTYKKPEFCFEKVFATMALACGKLQGTVALCKHRRRSS